MRGEMYYLSRSVCLIFHPVRIAFEKLAMSFAKNEPLVAVFHVILHRFLSDLRRYRFSQAVLNKDNRFSFLLLVTFDGEIDEIY